MGNIDGNCGGIEGKDLREGERNGGREEWRDKGMEGDRKGGIEE